jgi:NADH:ubiquinone reductase (H+-translocating)
MSTAATGRPRFLIIGGGYVGLYTAHRLLRKLQFSEATVTVVDPGSYMTYQPFLPEAAAGSLEPRHVVVPLRRVLPDAEVITARVVGVDHQARPASEKVPGHRPIGPAMALRRHPFV